jgi:hypothetical protein
MKKTAHTLTLVNFFSMYNNSKLVGGGRDNIIITSSCVELFTSGLRERERDFELIGCFSIFIVCTVLLI